MLTLICFFLLWMGCGGAVTAPQKDLAASDGGLLPALKDDTIQFRPGVDYVPENGTTLRIHFSESIRLGGQRIRIVDADGKKMEGAMERWAWDEERYVVRLEPTGLKEGTRFAVSVEGLVTEYGREIKGFSKSFVVRAVDKIPPDGSRLVFQGSAVVNTKETLELIFNEPIRWSSIGALSVLAGGEEVDGEWRLGPHQTRAMFIPASPWTVQPVFLSVGAGVADLAGNQMVQTPEGMMPLVSQAKPL